MLWQMLMGLAIQVYIFVILTEGGEPYQYRSL